MKKNCAPLGVARIAGIDEAGRGALAGPVVAAAAILPERFRHRKLNDSKQLAPELREEIYQHLTTTVRHRLGGRHCRFHRDRPDQYPARDAQGDARSQSRRSSTSARTRLIDGLPVFPFPLPQTAIIDGDCLSLSIAAASVIAKVTRDTIMRDFCARFPQYCFSQHKGYGTELHLQTP